MKIVILTCLYNDWASLEELLPLLDVELFQAGLTVDVCLVDDGSVEPEPKPLATKSFVAIQSVQLLQLRKNLGNQRAIAVGLAYIFEKLPCDAVVVMDADGEDRPADVVRLVQKMQSTTSSSIVFAERTKRSESFLFTLFYHVYRLVHVLLTGIGIRVGNFSIIPYTLLAGVVVDMNLWNHYAASVWMSKLPRTTIPTKRGRRLHGRSKLSFTALVVHGLSAISCYNEIISVRMLICTSIALLFLLLGVIAAVAIRVFTDWAIPGWTTYTVGILVIILLQLLLFSLVFTTNLLGGRIRQPFIPLRDYCYFIGRLRKAYPSDH